MNELYARETLPENYAESEKIDLVKNKKQMLLVHGLALVLAAALAVMGFWIQPEGASSVFDISANHMATAIKCFVLCAGIFAYIVGHEAVHGAFMWYYSRKKPHFGFSFAYAYAGSEVYFAKKPYLVIALAPLTVWGVVLAIINLLVPAGWFWVVWFIQLNNISGAAGDLFVSMLMSQKPADVLVQDTGTAMTVYLPKP